MSRNFLLYLYMCTVYTLYSYRRKEERQRHLRSRTKEGQKAKDCRNTKRHLCCSMVVEVVMVFLVLAIGYGVSTASKRNGR